MDAGQISVTKYLRPLKIKKIIKLAGYYNIGGLPEDRKANQYKIKQNK